MIKEQFITTRVRQTSLKKARLLSLFYILLSCPLSLTAQVSTVNYAVPTADAMVANGGVENTNFGSQTTIDVFHRNNQQIPMVFRSFIQFDLSNIPTNAVIVSADLKLTAQAVDNSQNHPLYIERVNGTNWTESTITWNAQPGVATADQISIPHSATSAVGLQTFDVKDHVQQMVANPGLNKGWRIRLQQEQAAVDFGVQYHSKEAAQSGDRPQLTVEYILPIEINTTVNHCTAGQTDGTLSAFLSGGSTHGLSNIFFYKTVRNASYDGTATITNVKTTHNVQYNTSTKEITAENLEPGVYILGVFDAEYYSGSDQRFVFYRHVLVGRDGEVTTGILYPDYRYQENVTISKDKPTAANPLDRANTNYHTHTSLIPLRVADAPDVYEYASLIQYEMDFDNQLEFTQADLRMKAWAQFFRFRNSSNALTYSRITSEWEEETVTWNTRPSIDASTGITLAATPTMGYETTHLFDTLDLLSFIPHWQSHPEDNHGIELALETYGATDYAQRSYKSASNENNYLELQWEVKEPVSASFDDNTNKGAITVHASGGTAPYTYLISSEPLGTLADIWTAIKDSTLIDSTDFFEGDTMARTMTFNNLPSGEYHVAVYDNTAAKLLDGSAIVNTTIDLISSTNLVFNDGLINRDPAISQGNGTGRLLAELQANDPQGGIRFTVAQLGDMVIGFNDASQPEAISATDFEYGIQIAANGNYQVIENNVVLASSGSLAVGTDVQLLKSGDTYYLLLNGAVVHSGDVPNLTGKALNVDLAFKDGVAQIKPKHYVDKLKKPGVSPKVLYPECGENIGDIQLLLGLNVTLASSSLVNNHTGASYTGAIDGGVFTFSDLPIGSYTLTASYTYTPPPGSGFGFSGILNEQVAVGYVVDWENLSGNYVTPLNTLRKGPVVVAGWATANSSNVADDSEFNWVQFETDFSSPLLDAGSFDNAERIRLRNQEGGIAYTLGTAEVGGTIVGYKIGIGTLFGPIATSPQGIWRLDIDGSTISLFKSNVNQITATTSGIEGPYELVVEQNGRAQYIKAIASFCNNYPVADQYIEPKRELQGGYFLVPNDDVLRFEFEEEYALAGDLNYVVRNFEGNEMAPLPTLSEVFGDNRFSLDVSSLSEGVYIMEIFNDKGENWFIRFKVD